MKKMFKIISLLLVAALLGGVAIPVGAGEKKANNEVMTPIETGFVDCSGVKIAYAIYGVADGEPLMLLHNNGGSMHSFDGNLLPEVAKHFKVITFDCRGYGQSDRGEGRLTFVNMAEDMVQMLDYFGIDKINLFGFSDGGNLAYVFAVAHPDRVKSLVAMGANINTRGTKTINQIGIVIKYWSLCIRSAFTDNADYDRERDIQGLMVGQPNLKYEDLAVIKAPTLNIYGEHDMMKRSHSEKITASIEGARGLMLIGAAHSDGFEQTKTAIVPAMLSLYRDNNIPFAEAE